jgi:hypothetical protein
LISWDQSNVRAWEAADALETAQRPPAFFDENGADASPEARELRHRVQAEILGILEKLDATQEREGRDLDVANRLEATGLLFGVFARHAQRPPVSPEVRDAMRALRAIEVADRVDHSEHVGGDGEPCGVERSWGSRMGRDLAAALDALEAAQRPPVSPVLDAINDAREAVARGERPSIIIDTDDYLAPERPPVSPETTTNIDGIGKAVAALVPMCENETHAWNLWNYIASDRGALRDALLHAYRPPVSPEQREAVRAVVGEQLTRAGLDLDGPPFADDGETQWPVALELRDRITDAILARLSLPVLDAEKVAEAAQAEVNQAHPEWHDVGVGIVQGSHYRAGFVAGAKWAVASLHTLTTDGTPADTERNES